VVDVEGWLAAMPAGALDGWQAYYGLEPWDLPREHWPDVRSKVKAEKMLTPAESMVQMRQAFGV
jgi:hypothetical protein